VFDPLDGHHPAIVVGDQAAGLLLL
jgi:hypothetical protein